MNRSMGDHLIIIIIIIIIGIGSRMNRVEQARGGPASISSLCKALSVSRDCAHVCAIE